MTTASTARCSATRSRQCRKSAEAQGRSATIRWTEAFDSQIRAIGAGSQKRLRDSIVAVQGLGRVGSTTSLMLRACGVGRIIGNDPQPFELENFNALCASAAHVGLRKSERLKALMPDTLGMTFHGIADRNESSLAEEAVKDCSLVACTSNTPEGRIASQGNAITYEKPYVGIGVSDCRGSLVASVVVWRPDRPELACQACFLSNGFKADRDAALFFPAVAMAASLGTYLIVAILAGLQHSTADANLFLLNLSELSLESLCVHRCPRCRICGRG